MEAWNRFFLFKDFHRNNIETRSEPFNVSSYPTSASDSNDDVQRFDSRPEKSSVGFCWCFFFSLFCTAQNWKIPSGTVNDFARS